jgi:hypothetical protein
VRTRRYGQPTNVNRWRRVGAFLHSGTRRDGRATLAVTPYSRVCHWLYPWVDALDITDVTSEKTVLMLLAIPATTKSI